MKGSISKPAPLNESRQKPHNTIFLSVVLEPRIFPIERTRYFRETRYFGERIKIKAGRDERRSRIEMLEAWRATGSTWKARSDVSENKLLPRFQFLTRSGRSFFSTTFAPSTRPIYAQSSRIRRSSLCPYASYGATVFRWIKHKSASIKYAANVTDRYI